jgi:hypothetical protein
MIEITYDRSQKQYTCTIPTTGEILTAPAGAANKATLFQAAVGMLDPDLYAAAAALIEDHPQLERVTWKGVELVCAGGVEAFAAPKAGVVAMVDSSDGYGRYAITHTDSGYECQCGHFQELHAPVTRNGRWCKHITAYRLYLRVREDRF